MVIWFIGLSGSGKTTLGREVAQRWRAFAQNTVFLDGDEVRDVFKHDRGEQAFSKSGRRQNAERMTALCELLDRQGINVVCCILSIFPEMRAENRTRFSEYFEVFMDAPMDSLKRRDVKGLYAAAERGEERNVVGIDIAFKRPEGSDLVVDSSGDEPDIAALAEMVLETAMPR
ncbi:MAG: adenylyl-sulfate kinase [Pseudomonadota bacterium]